MAEELKPQDFDGYVGQEAFVSNLKVYIKAARQRKVPLDHMLLAGPPGIGKTSLVEVTAHALGVPMVTVIGTALNKPEQLSQLASLPEGGIFFIDEIHGISPKMQDALLLALEGFKIWLKDPRYKDLTEISVPKFTCIGATTELGRLAKPLRDRFGVMGQLTFLKQDAMLQLVLRSSSILGLKATPEGLLEIVKRSRGTPRVANNFLRRVVDFALVENKVADAAFVSGVARRMGIDGKGLTRLDRDVLRVIANQFSGGPVGIEAIASTLSESVETIASVQEPYLVKKGLLARQPKGRVITAAGRKYLERLKQHVTDSASHAGRVN